VDTEDIKMNKTYIMVEGEKHKTMYRNKEKYFQVVVSTMNK
jgi:hypothetical protein